MNNQNLLLCGLIDAHTYVRHQDELSMRCQLSNMALSKVGALLTESDLYCIIEYLSSPSPTCHQRILFNKAISKATSKANDKEANLVKCLSASQYKGEGLLDFMLSSLQQGGFDVFKIHQGLLEVC